MYGEKWPADSEVVRAALSATASTANPEEQLLARAATWGRWVSVAVAVIAAACAAAWPLGHKPLTDLFPSLPPMEPWVAINLAVLGVVIATVDVHRPGWFKVPWHLAAAFVVGSSAFFVDQEIDYFNRSGVQIFNPAPVSVDDLAGHPSFMSLTALAITGVAVMLARHRMYGGTQLLAVLTAVLAFVAINTYAFHPNGLFEFGTFTTMALPTAILLLGLTFSLFDFALRGGPLSFVAAHGEGGLLIRRMLPVSLAGLLVLEILAAGIASRTTTVPSFTYGLAMTATMVMVSGLIFAQARALRRVDARRTGAEEALEVVRQLMQTRDELTGQLDERSRALRQIIETSPDGFVAMDEEGKVTAWNPAAEALFGWSSDEVMGRSLHEIIVPEFDFWVEQGGDFPDRVGSIEAFQARSKDVDSIHKDGSRIRVDLTLWPATEEPCRAYYAFARDVTARSEAQEREAALLRELDEQSRVLKQIIDTSPDAFVAMDEAGKVTSWNPAAEEIFGWARHEVLGRSLHEIIVPEYEHWVQRGGDFPDRVESIEAFRSRSKDVDSVRKDGSRIRVDLTLWPATEEPSRAYYAFARDVTVRRDSEERLLEANADLREFAAIAAHDLRNPLVAVRLAAEMLAESTKDGVIDDQGREWIGRIQAATLRGQELISDLLEYSSLTSGPRETTRVDLTRLAEEVADQVAVSTDRKFVVQLEPLPVIEGDLPRLRQLFVNLFGNAAKYVPSDRPATVHVSARTGRRMVRIVVTDNGDGISDADKGSVFGAFQRGSAKRDTPGTGIGLAICRKVVERHGGTIKIEDAEGGGASFVIELPRWPGAMTIGLGGEVPTSLASGYGN